MRSVTQAPSTILYCLALWLAIFSYSSTAAPYNGFNVQDALIPVKKIMQGGPPRDGIPAIDTPRFTEAIKAQFLKPDSPVIGVKVNGIAKAYPIAILNWHEVVNDTFGDQGIVVTFCPLCGTGVVYEAGHQGKILSFGVSGLLYNSDVLLYDRTTESLWSQLKSQAISGPLKGQHLVMVPSQLTSWENWQHQHPDTSVLSVNTGYRRDYSRNPYEGYETAPGLAFPVEFLSYRYHPKERVIGLLYKGVVKAYPFAELAKLGDKGMVKDWVADEQLSIKFDAGLRNARIFAGERELATINAFWFAWYAFYPDTLVFDFDSQ
ncbi:MAG: DUF3179 domain-containing protein [Motiliproteus sp.]|nr:DUF3179 domain-containing protein [Motiliproteus sp.]MCW9053038.1 DUF3179 domain-containing protein [Motiliproteus sp.]